MGFDAEFAVIGHRGAAGLAAENTLPSFCRAFELGVDAIELDVHLCDDVLVVIHDAELDRTTNGQGRVDEMPLASLRALDAGGGAPIPTLAEVIEITPIDTGINVELKGAGTAGPVSDALDAIGHDVLVSSFDHQELRRFVGYSTAAKHAPLFRKFTKSSLALAAELDAWSVNLGNRHVRRNFVEDIRNAGFRVFVYTVNELSRAKELRGWGVNGVFTDVPDQIHRTAMATL